MKKKIIKDINFDYMTILVRADSINIIRQYYQNFSWEIFDEYKYGLSGNTIALELRRPHKIADKDKLQYFQVQMEFNLNEQSKLEKSKHNKSLSMGIVFCLICAIILATSVFIFIKTSAIALTMLGVLLALIGLVLIFVAIFIISKTYKQEIEDFNNKTEQIFDIIDKICEKVKPNQSKKF